MSERVTEFLIMLSKDPVKLDAFLDDPGPLLRESRLSREEQDLLLSGDPERIRAYIGENTAFAAGASTTSQHGFPGNVVFKFNFQFPFQRPSADPGADPEDEGGDTDTDSEDGEGSGT